jgi:hypothetical protein
MHENACAVDDRLNAGRGNVHHGCPDLPNHCIESGNRFLRPENPELPAHHVEHHRTRQAGVTEGLQDFVH